MKINWDYFACLYFDLLILDWNPIFVLFDDWELRLEQATGLAFRFVIGRSKDEKKMAELEKEIKEHRDFVLLDDVEEEYLRLPYKT